MDYLLVTEVLLSGRTGDVTVVLSIPGREGTVTRTWRGRDSGQRVTVSQMDDISCWVSQAVTNYLLGAAGAQGELLQP